MKGLFYAYLLLLFTGVSGAPIQAQPASRTLVRAVDQNIYQSTKRLLSAYQDYVGRPASGASADLSAVLNLLQQSFVRTDTLQAALLDQKLEVERRQSGLILRSSFSTQSALDVQQEELGLVSNTPLTRVGVEWDLLNSGWLETNEEAEAAALERELFQYQRNQQLQHDNFSYRQQYLIRQFDRQKATLHEQRGHFLAQTVDILEGLYHTHQLAYASVLDYRRRLEESRFLATTYQNTVAQGGAAPMVEVSTLPVLDITISKLLSAAAKNPHADDIRRVRKKQVELEYSPAADWQLRASLNYNYTFGGQRFPAVGLSLRAPLVRPAQTERELVRVQQALIDQEVEQRQYQVERQLLNLYQEYTFLQKQYLEKVHKLVEGQEQIRVQRTLREQQQADPVSPLPLLELYDEQLAGRIDLLELKQQMYLRLLRMHTLCPHVDLRPVLRPVSFGHVAEKVAGQRLLLFTPRDLTRFSSIDFYVAYLRKNELQTILLRADEVADWLPYFRKKGFAVWIPASTGESWQQRAQGSYRLFADEITVQHNSRKETLAYPYLTVTPRSFDSRYALEQWVSRQNNRPGATYFLFRGAAALYTQELEALQNLSQNIQR